MKNFQYLVSFFAIFKKFLHMNLKCTSDNLRISVTSGPFSQQLTVATLNKHNRTTSHVSVPSLHELEA